ncbi:MAG: hypothetical protein D5R98_02525 [Desulfonatronovibrio sp. MSAO_Bac4]|nr:MAG: hypothetical protein D5R98_02525 [Desulfonatronovibrio sp. MSAO_Bac4]
MNISSVNNFNLDVANTVQNETAARGQSQADEMKGLQKARLNRQIMQDPSLVSKIVALESTMVYNSSAELVQAVSPTSLEK